MPTLGNIKPELVATGLALTIFSSGLSAFVGAGYVGKTIAALQPIGIPILKVIPVLGPALFKLIGIYSGSQMNKPQ